MMRRMVMMSHSEGVNEERWWVEIETNKGVVKNNNEIPIQTTLTNDFNNCLGSLGSSSFGWVVVVVDFGCLFGRERTLLTKNNPQYTTNKPKQP